MNILAANDDGIGEGIMRLVAAFRAAGHHVLAVVPDRNRSGASHSITFDRSIPLRETEKDIYTYGGTPVDCILAALVPGGLGYRPDIIISGINAGPNLGTDIIYSGTAAAARQGSLYDIPSFAFSVDGETPYHFAEAARWAVDHLDDLLASWQKDTFVNVNFPNTADFAEALFTYPALRIYEDRIIITMEGAEGITESIMKDTESIMKDTEGIMEDTEGMMEDTEGITESIMKDTEGIMEDTEGMMEDTEGMMEGTTEDTEGTMGDTEGIGIMEDTDTKDTEGTMKGTMKGTIKGTMKGNVDNMQSYSLNGGGVTVKRGNRVLPGVSDWEAVLQNKVSVSIIYSHPLSTITHYPQSSIIHSHPFSTITHYPQSSMNP